MAIPDRPMRRDALDSLARKRSHIDGAALFTIIPCRRSAALLQVLIAYQIMFDFLDSVNERSCSHGPANGVQLHLALIDALDPGAPLADYFAFSPWRDDGGYLLALVQACRRSCALLPGYSQVRELLLGEALGFEVLALNHIASASERDGALRSWAAGRPASALRWYEQTAGGSSTLAVHALLALAAEPGRAAADMLSARWRYAEVISVMGTMLDSYVDQIEDRQSGDHSYVAHYPTTMLAVTRLRSLIERSLQASLGLVEGERHAVIVACMVAMYLSKDSASSPELRLSSVALASAGGSLTGLLLPMLRVWRAVYAQRPF